LGKKIRMRLYLIAFICYLNIYFINLYEISSILECLTSNWVKSSDIVMCIYLPQNTVYKKNVDMDQFNIAYYNLILTLSMYYIMFVYIYK